MCNEQTFSTLRLLREKLPQLITCISTNGLLLSDLSQTLKKVGVATVSVTVNAVNPAIAARIYTSVTVDGIRLTGLEGAELLIERQMAGIATATAAGLIVKVNSVMCPGINTDGHIQEIALEARKHGASMLNIMPLIPCGSFLNQRKPDKLEVEMVRKACEAIIPVMRHCQQCRSDAVGLLEENRCLSHGWVAASA